MSGAAQKVCQGQLPYSTLVALLLRAAIDLCAAEAESARLRRQIEQLEAENKYLTMTVHFAEGRWRRMQGKQGVRSRF